MRHPLLFLTDRGAAHQAQALRACPPGVAMQILRAPAPEEAIAAIAGAELVISERNVPVTAAMIRAAPKLRLIVRLGSLAHDIDLDVARVHGVRVSLQPVRSSIAAAEHVLMMILALLKRLGTALETIRDERAPRSAPLATHEDQFAYNWADLSDVRMLHQRDVAILGMGEIGVELARRLRPFALRSLTYFKRRPYPIEVERELGATWADAPTAARAADVVVSLLPYSASTAASIGAQLLSEMRPNAVLVHAGSGGVVDEAALLDALIRRKLAGAALDTFVHEPLPHDHPLIARARDPRSNLLLTPHVASGTEALDREDDFAEIIRFLNGEPLAHAMI